MRFFARLLTTIAQTFSITLEVFIRHTFGERYLRSFNLFFSICAVFVVFNWGALWDNSNDAQSFVDVLVNFFSFSDSRASVRPLKNAAALFVFVSIGHLGYIHFRNVKGEAWYSHSKGKSIFYPAFLPITENTFQMYIEPLLCLVIGYMLYALDGSIGQEYGHIGLWIIFSSIFLFLKEQGIYQRERARILDRQDVSFLREQDTGNVGKEFSVSLAQYSSAGDIGGLQDFYDRLGSVSQLLDFESVPDSFYKRSQTNVVRVKDLGFRLRAAYVLMKIVVFLSGSLVSAIVFWGTVVGFGYLFIAKKNLSSFALDKDFEAFTIFPVVLFVGSSLSHWLRVNLDADYYFIKIAEFVSDRLLKTFLKLRRLFLRYYKWLALGVLSFALGGFGVRYGMGVELYGISHIAFLLGIFLFFVPRWVRIKLRALWSQDKIILGRSVFEEKYQYIGKTVVESPKDNYSAAGVLLAGLIFVSFPAAPFVIYAVMMDASPLMLGVVIFLASIAYLVFPLGAVYHRGKIVCRHMSKSFYFSDSIITIVGFVALLLFAISLSFIKGLFPFAGVVPIALLGVVIFCAYRVYWITRNGLQDFIPKRKIFWLSDDE